MVNMMHAFGGKTVQPLPDLRHHCIARQDFAVELSGCGVERISYAMRCIVKSMNDLVNCIKPQSCFGKAIADRAQRKITRMLVPVEAFFSRGCD